MLDACRRLLVLRLFINSYSRDTGSGPLCTLLKFRSNQSDACISFPCKVKITTRELFLFSRLTVRGHWLDSPPSPRPLFIRRSRTSFKSFQKYHRLIKVLKDSVLFKSNSMKCFSKNQRCLKQRTMKRVIFAEEIMWPALRASDTPTVMVFL